VVLPLKVLRLRFCLHLLFSQNYHHTEFQDATLYGVSAVPNSQIRMTSITEERKLKSDNVDW